MVGSPKIENVSRSFAQYMIEIIVYTHILFLLDFLAYTFEKVNAANMDKKYRHACDV